MLFLLTVNLNESSTLGLYCPLGQLITWCVILAIIKSKLLCATAL